MEYRWTVNTASDPSYETNSAPLYASSSHTYTLSPHAPLPLLSYRRHIVNPHLSENPSLSNINEWHFPQHVYVSHRDLGLFLISIIMLMFIRLNFTSPDIPLYLYLSSPSPSAPYKPPLFHLTLAQLNSSYLLCILTYLPQLPTYHS